MIAHDKKSQLQEILRNYPKKFKRLGKLKNYQIQLHMDSITNQKYHHKDQYHTSYSKKYTKP